MWFSHLLPVFKCWDSYIDHTVPGSLIRPYSSLNQSNAPVFLPVEFREEYNLIKGSGVFSVSVLQVSRRILTHSYVFFMKLKQSLVCQHCLFFSQFEINPGDVCYCGSESSMAVKHTVSLRYCFFMMLQLWSLPSDIKLRNISSADKRWDPLCLANMWMYTIRNLYLLFITAVTKLSKL